MLRREGFRVGLRQENLEVLLASEDARKCIANVGTRLDPEFPARRDDRERVGRVLRAFIVPDEQPRLAIQNPSAKIPFDLVVGQLHLGISQERCEPFPLPMHVAEGLTQLALGLDAGAAAVEPGAELADERSTLLLSPTEPLLEGLTAAGWTRHPRGKMAP